MDTFGRRNTFPDNCAAPTVKIKEIPRAPISKSSFLIFFKITFIAYNAKNAINATYNAKPTYP